MRAIRARNSNKKDLSPEQREELLRALKAGLVANPHRGTKFSFVILKVTDGKPLKITSKFGGIPEMYLTLRACLAQSNP
jgi:hypothetical protein